jgi:hypothetical protein
MRWSCQAANETTLTGIIKLIWLVGSFPGNAHYIWVGVRWVGWRQEKDIVGFWGWSESKTIWQI